MLSVAVANESYGDALFSYLQAIDQISNVTRMTKERVASAFMEDFEALLTSILPKAGREFNWHDPQRDPDKNYAVDCRYQHNGGIPWYVFAVNSTGKCQDATIASLWYERQGFEFGSVALYEDQASVSRRSVAQLSDIVGKQFSSIGDRDRISKYFEKEVLKART